MSNAGRKATRVCSNVTYYLSSEAQVKLLKLSKGRKSAYLDKLIIEAYEKHSGDLEREDQEVEELLSTQEGGEQNNSLLSQ